ncbi:MAG TPA: hypothetical protein VGR12_03240 [Solirubrobacteraceae bacterium]|nr:hypothetical protein [Solirubrobacteraceae bacterium]
MRRLPSHLVALVLGLLAAFAVSCGDGGDDRRLLRPSDAEAIREELDKIEQRVERGECDDLDPAFVRLNRTIDELPQRTDPQLRSRLVEGAEHLAQLADRECEPETTETQPETTETLPPETVEPPPETVEPPPETVAPPPTTPVPPEGTGGEEAPSGFVPPGQAKKEADG